MHVCHLVHYCAHNLLYFQCSSNSVKYWNGWLTVITRWSALYIQNMTIQVYTDYQSIQDTTGKCADTPFNFSNRISKVNMKRTLPSIKHKYHSLMHFDTSSQMEYFWLQIRQQLSDTQCWHFPGPQLYTGVACFLSIYYQEKTLPTAECI